jgi:diguanylate cyclase (GGDEF)-like protein/PAS domain S-box-containing protein
VERENGMDTGERHETSDTKLTELLLSRLFDTLGDGLLVINHEHIILQANRWLEDRFVEQMPLVGKSLGAVLGDDPQSTAGLRPLDAMENEVHIEIPRRRAPEHTDEWFRVSAYPVRIEDGTTAGALLHLEDITERKRLEKVLTDEIFRWRTMVDQSRDGIVVFDQRGKVREANQAFARMLGRSLDEVYGLQVWDWDASYSRAEIQDMIDAVDSTGDHFETTHRRKDGTTYVVEISSNGAVFGGEKLVFCVCRDITEKKAMEERIRQLAIRDPLTEIYNRRYIFERLDEIAAEYARGGADFCVSILDLDHFKSVNDTHGHMAGDFVLREFARTVSSAIRPYDLLGRYGGEEFIIVSKNATWYETTSMIERVMGLVRAKGLLFDQHPISMTFSCGVADSAELAREVFSVEQLVKLADDRLYLAKVSGRDLCIGPRESACRAADRSTPDLPRR